MELLNKYSLKSPLAETITFLSVLLLFACANKMHFNKSSVTPAASGSVKLLNDKDGNYAQQITLSHLTPPEKLIPPKKYYVIWMITTDNKTVIAGQLENSKSSKTSLKTVTFFKPQSFFITAEDSASPHTPDSVIILQTH